MNIISQKLLNQIKFQKINKKFFNILNLKEYIIEYNKYPKIIADRKIILKNFKLNSEGYIQIF